ncbi:28091_t:CDS:2, partial [Racocetra persica]
GTKKLLLRDDTMPDGSKHIMTYIDNANIKRPKRIKRVFKERGLWIPGLIKNAYKLGLSGKTADFAVKKYHSHRQILEQVLEEFAYD